MLKIFKYIWHTLINDEGTCCHYSIWFKCKLHLHYSKWAITLNDTSSLRLYMLASANQIFTSPDIMIYNLLFSKLKIRFISGKMISSQSKKA